jgi:hypothetical protein
VKVYRFQPAQIHIVPTDGGAGVIQVVAVTWVVRAAVRITDLMPLGAVWTPDEGTQPFDPGLFDG